MNKAVIILMLLMPLMAKEATVEQLFNVQTVKVKAQKSVQSRKNYGYVKVDESRVYDVVPRYGGYIVTLYADKLYQKVRKGEKLAKVYSPEILQAKEDYINAVNYDRQRPNAAMVESAKEKLQLLGVEEREINAVRRSGRAGRYSYITAPSSGYLFEKNVNNLGAFAAKQKLFTIVDLEKVWVEVKVYQKELSGYRNLTDFSVTAVGTDGVYAAKKMQLYPNIDPKMATATLRLEVMNAKADLLPGMYATITASSTPETYLTLPTTAVIRKNGQFYVFGVGEFEGEYEPKTVDVEPLDNNTYIVKSGLDAGDEVVDNALFMMDSDAQINGLY